MVLQIEKYQSSFSGILIGEKFEVEIELEKKKLIFNK